MGLALALLLATASGQFQHTHVRPGGLSKVFPEDGASSNVAFAFLPADGTGMPVVGDLCSLYSGELTGNYFCLKPDGTQMSAAATTLTAQGTPTTASAALCPNGLNCAAATSQRLNGTSQYFKTANVAAPSGDFSCWVAFIKDSLAAGSQLVAKDSDTANQRSVSLNTSAQPALTVYKADGSSSSVSGGATATIAGALHLLVATYDFVADGTSVGKLYIDGTQTGSTNSTMVGPPQAAASGYWAIGRREYSGFPDYLAGNIFSAGCTEKVLDAATVAAMAHAVLADNPTGTKGEVLTFTRNSVKICDPSDGGVTSVLPAGRICIEGGGYHREGAATNLVLRNRDLSHAAWTKSSMTCTLTATGVDGLPATASTCTASGANGTALQQFTVSAATRSMSLDIRRHPGGGTGPVNVTRDNGTTWTVVTLTSAFQRFTPLTTPALSSGGANPTVGIRIVTNGDAVDVDYVQDEDGSVASSRIATAGTSVTRGNESASFPSPANAGMNTKEGCTLVTINPGWSGSPSTTDYIVALNAATSARVPYLQNGTDDVRTYDGTHVVVTARTFTASTPFVARTSWTASGNQLRVNTTGGTAVTSALTAVGAIDQLQVGNLSGSGAQPLILSNIMLGKNSLACGSTP